MRAFYFYAGLFNVTAATLMLQLIQTRILSVVAWYHLAFFVISTAMFGLTAGAVWVYLRGARFTQKTLSSDLAHYSTAFAVATVLALALQMTLVPMARPSITMFIIWVELAVVLSVPFFFSGVVVSLALTRSPYPVGRVYGVDLLGAALGCFGVLFLLDTYDGPSAVLWTATFIVLGALFFARSGIGSEPAVTPRFAGIMKWRRTWLLVFVATATLNSLDYKRLGLYPVFAKGNLEYKELPWYEKWNSFSRVVARFPRQGTPAMWGPSPKLVAEDWRLRQSRIDIDGGASSTAYGVAGELAPAQFLRFDVTNLAYHLPNLKSAAIVGVGGGRDILSAQVFGVPKVAGIEINPVFVDLLLHQPQFSDFVGLNKLEGVSLIVDEARSWFARSSETFDLVQMSLIDTWASTGAGAFTLSENGLYTVESWQIFLRRLNPSGVFTVSRWYSPEHVAETGRMVSLAVAALLESGVKTPRDHIYLASRRRVATLIVSRSGFSADELQSLKMATADLGFDQLITPDEEPISKVLGEIVNTGDRTELESQTRAYRLDLTPPTDDRPFFFNQLPFHDAAKVAALALSGRATGVGYGNLFATATLLILFVIALGLVTATVLVPLRSALNDVGSRLASAGTVYFMLIGIGFMLIEIGFLQRFSVFLGHPTYSLSIVLFSLILSTGLGSILSDYVGIATRVRFTLWAIATGGYVLSQVLWLPPLLLWFDSSPLALRGLVSIAVVLPAGLLMGFGFPTGMRLVSAFDERPTPWFWGINGASGVLASAVAVACSIAYGIGTTLTLGALAYVLLVPAALIIGFPANPANQGRNPLQSGAD